MFACTRICCMLPSISKALSWKFSCNGVEIYRNRRLSQYPSVDSEGPSRACEAVRVSIGFNVVPSWKVGEIVITPRHDRGP